MSFHRACCCGAGGPLPGCPTHDTCDTCGDLTWAVRGTLIWDIYSGATLLQRQTWSFQTLDIITRNHTGTGCQWNNNKATSGSDADFLTYSGTYVLWSLGSGTRSASNFMFTEPTQSVSYSTWGTSSLCDPVTFVETLSIDLSPSTFSPPYEVADDQTGALLDVTPPLLDFVRNANRDCPVGTFNAVDNGDATNDYPSLPYLESAP